MLTETNESTQIWKDAMDYAFSAGKYARNLEEVIALQEEILARLPVVEKMDGSRSRGKRRRGNK